MTQQPSNETSMNLTELKKNSVAELLNIAKEMGSTILRVVANKTSSCYLKKHAKNGEAIYGDGVLEVLPVDLAS